ncbi:hypothetical protein [Devosia sp. Leaf64]|uniref:hypothetical protein n=1 Tax=Devosia sp. Leaf64 TaxID=1736229 RepID=UPI0007158D69|nr:hypothetical protein [Devosia sp. Leaf64]KQN72406.1 hypothetical protein ASE94_07790 [Devosia sp. Leaf64]
MPKHIVIPDEREAQLRKIMKDHNLPSVADAVALLIGWAVEGGHVAPGVPGIEVSRKANLVTVDFGDFQRVMSVELAQAYAICLRWFASPKGENIGLAARHVSEMFSGAHVVGLSRRGPSVKVKGENGVERTLAFSVARDLAELIQKAAA